MSETSGVTKNEGIQKLLEAEKEATKIVDEARQHKMKRLKQAKAEAKTDLEKLTSEYEVKYKEIETKIMDSTFEDTFNKKIETELIEMEKRVKETENAVIQSLVDQIKNVTIQLPRNYVQGS